MILIEKISENIVLGYLIYEKVLCFSHYDDCYYLDTVEGYHHLIYDPIHDVVTLHDSLSPKYDEIKYLTPLFESKITEIQSYLSIAKNSYIKYTDYIRRQDNLDIILK